MALRHRVFSIASAKAKDRPPTLWSIDISLSPYSTYIQSSNFMTAVLLETSISSIRSLKASSRPMRKNRPHCNNYLLEEIRTKISKSAKVVRVLARTTFADFEILRFEIRAPDRSSLYSKKVLHLILTYL